MSVPNRPSFQKPTKSSSSSSSSLSSSAAAAGGAPGVRWNGAYSAGVSPVRGLSPVRSTFHGTARQDLDMARSHTNPLFSSRTAESGRLNNTPTKLCKEAKENREKQQEPWKVPAEKAQYSGKTLCTTPGKTTRTPAAMRFTTPPKPVVKRKILAENRELVSGTSRMKEDITARTPKKEVISEPAAVSRARNDETQCRAEEGFSSLSPERSSSIEPTKPKSPLVSIEELQKRIQKFLQDEGPSATVPVPMSPRRSTESLRRSMSGTTTCEESSLTVVEEAPFQPMMAPYSPRPEYSRARKSPSPPVSMEGNASPVRGEGSLVQENTTPTYDPKNNFLSPRPQYLRYRPLRRLELLRKSAEGTLADLDLDSPATDAESSRMGSEKDEKEESESQDASQEAQSLKSSVESPPPHCKVSSSELFKSAEINEEIVQLRTEELKELEELEEPQEPQESISSAMPPPPVADAGWDVPSTLPELEDVNFREEDEEELEDADLKNKPSNLWHKAFGIVTVVALVALLVVASGSPALLPTSLHQSYISHLWKTARVTEPIRQFLQTTEGLWAENNPPSRDFALTSPYIVRVGCMHVSSLVQAVDFSQAVRIGKSCWSFCKNHGVRFGRFTKASYINFKASLEEAMDEYKTHGQEVNEWGWVHDYEFVVPHDMVDPAEAYAKITARVESWDVKSFWSSLTQTQARQPVTQLIVQKSTNHNLDGTMESSNSSICLLSAGSKGQSALIFRSGPPASDRVIAAVPLSGPSKDIDSNSIVHEQSGEGTIIHPYELTAVSGGSFGEGSLLSVLNDQEVEDDVVMILSAQDLVRMEAEYAVEVIEDVESFPLAAEEETLRSPDVEVGELSRDDGEKAEEEILLSSGTEVISIEIKNAVEAAAEAESFPSVSEAESFPSVAEEEILLCPGIEVIELKADGAEKIQLAPAVEGFQELEVSMGQSQLLPLQEALEEESSVREGEVEAFSVPTSLGENIIDSHMPQENRQESARLLTLEQLMHAPAAVATSILVAAVSAAALLVGYKISARSGNSRRLASLKASAQGISNRSSIEPQFQSIEPQFQSIEPQFQSLEPQYKSFDSQYKSFESQYKSFESQVKSFEHQFKSSEPQFKSTEPLFKSSEPQFKSTEPLFKSSEPQFKSSEPQFRVVSRFQPVEDITANDFYAEAPPTEQVSADHLRQFSTPYPITPDRVLGKVTGKDRTPTKSFSPAPNGDTPPSPDVLSSGILEDSSLGRFVTVVPVVRNEGTARERVQLTPVRRSSRIRTRMQNSPCHLLHSPHLCNC